MNTIIWLKIKGRKKYHSWEGRGATAYKNKPDLEADEIAIKIDLEVPDSLFETPQLVAKIVVPDGATSAPEIDADVVDNIRQVLADQLGITVHISAGENDG